MAANVTSPASKCRTRENTRIPFRCLRKKRPFCSEPNVPRPVPRTPNFKVALHAAVTAARKRAFFSQTQNNLTREGNIELGGAGGAKSMHGSLLDGRFFRRHRIPYSESSMGAYKQTSRRSDSATTNATIHAERNKIIEVINASSLPRVETLGSHSGVCEKNARLVQSRTS